MRVFVLAEFAAPEAMVAAAGALRASGFVDLDTHSPFPVHGVDEALALPRSRAPLWTLVGGLTGVATAYLMMWWCNAVDYPIVVGNRPPLGPSSGWLPEFVPITFELGVLFGAFGAFLSVFYFNRLPRPHHPVFELEAFRTATVDRFWISLATESAESRSAALRSLEQLGTSRVFEVPESEAAAARAD